MTSPYVKYSFWEKAGIVLTTSPTATPVTSLPTASTMPADSYPRPAGYFGDSMYWSQRHIDSARFKPIALTLIRTSCGPGAFTFVSMNSRTSGPPAFGNLMVRDTVISSLEFIVPLGTMKVYGAGDAGQGPTTLFFIKRRSPCPRGARDSSTWMRHWTGHWRCSGHAGTRVPRSRS